MLETSILSASSRNIMGKTKGNQLQYLYAEQWWESSVKFIGSKDNDNDNTLFKRRKIKNKIVKVSLERGYFRG